MRGLKRKTYYPEFLELLQQFDIFCTVETNLDQYDNVDLKGYTFFGKCRKSFISRKSGGIGLYIRNEFSNSAELVSINCEYLMLVKLNRKPLSLDQDLFLAVVYLPPSGSKYLDEDELQNLENEICHLCSEHKYCLFIGDVNARTASMPDFIPTDDFLSEYFQFDDEIITLFNKAQILENSGFPLSRCSQDSQTNAHGVMLTDLCKNNNLFILNGRVGHDKSRGRFTYRNVSVIDYAFATPECFQYFIDFEVIDTDALLSDGHCVLSLTLNKHGKTHRADGMETHQHCKWNPLLRNDFLNNINTQNIAQIELLCESESPPAIDSITNEISRIFKDSATKTFPNKTFDRSKNDKPWFGHKCRRDRKAYHKAKSKYNKVKSFRNRDNLKRASKNYKKTMNFYINQYKFSKSAKLRNLHSRNPKHYWKFINSLKGKPASETPSPEEFYEFFKDRNKSPDPDEDFPLPENFLLNSQETLNAPITEEEICTHIRNLKNAKSPSPSDLIINEYIKSTETLFLPIYRHLFNSVLNTGHLPESWLEGYIIPIYKNKGGRDQPDNYRPITILSCLGKLFTSILNSRINNFLEEFDLLNENQAGFRAGYSTTDHIFLLHSLIEIMKHSKKKLYCAFIDFAMAFDSVWRIGLWQKLLSTSINGKLFRVIYNMYNNIKSCVFQGKNTNFFPCEVGVRQGENLSPVMFSIFLNDLDSFLNSTGCNGVNINLDDATNWLKLLVILYADDTLILSDNVSDFQKSLSSFYEYCREWKLTVNLSKSKVVIFGSKNVRDFQFYLGEQEIEIVDRYKYLGVIFQNNGSFKATRNHLIEQAKKAMHLLYSRIHNLDLPIDLQLKLFDHTILPILTYGCEIWGYESLDGIEKVHNEFLRKIGKLRKSTPLYMLYGEFGRHPVSISIKSRMTGFWNRLLMGKKTKLSFLMYQYILTHNNDSKWIAKVREILSNIGRPDLFLFQNTLNSKHINKTVTRTLTDQFQQKWEADMQISSKGRQYHMFKKTIELESYLTLVPRNLSYLILKLRTANHRFPVETGRWYNIPNENRICTLCNLAAIGDEAHYLFTCPRFRNEREKFMNPFLNNNHEFALTNLLVSKNYDSLTNLGKFLKIVFKINFCST